MLAAHELRHLADDIASRGLIHPIVLDGPAPCSTAGTA